MVNNEVCNVKVISRRREEKVETVREGREGDHVSHVGVDVGSTYHDPDSPFNPA
jgi:hypothetical protein